MKSFINRRGKNWVCNIRYGPQTWLVRGISFFNQIRPWSICICSLFFPFFTFQKYFFRLKLFSAAVRSSWIKTKLFSMIWDCKISCFNWLNKCNNCELKIKEGKKHIGQSDSTESRVKFRMIPTLFNHKPDKGVLWLAEATVAVNHLRIHWLILEKCAACPLQDTQQITYVHLENFFLLF